MSDITEVQDDDLATLLAKREHAKPNKVTWVLLVLLILTVGFAGGAVVNQKVGTSSSTAGFTGPPAGFTRPAMSGGGATTGGSSGAPTVGTVKLVDATNVYVATSDGAVVKVKVPDSASIVTEKPIELSDIAAGTTITVSGEAAADGTVTATSITRQPTQQGAN